MKTCQRRSSLSGWCLYSYLPLFPPSPPPVYPTWYWKIVRAPESEIRADRSHTPCFSLLDYCLAFYCVCICCKPSTVKSCNIFAKIFIHQPGLRHCRVNEQQLLAHSKWILPARYPTWVFLLFFFLFFCLFFYLGLLLWRCRWCRIWEHYLQHLTACQEMGYFVSVKTTRHFLGKRKKKVHLIVSGGKYNLRKEKHVIECIIISTVEARPNW